MSQHNASGDSVQQQAANDSGQTQPGVDNQALTSSHPLTPAHNSGDTATRHGEFDQGFGNQSLANEPEARAILDPQTGGVHPVPDLAHLQDQDAMLIVVSGPDAGAQILLDTDRITVGRLPDADIFLDDVTVSRKHAEFIRSENGFTLRDTNSLNGTYVGRQLIDSIELQNGADVQIGKFRMIYRQR